MGMAAKKGKGKKKDKGKKVKDLLALILASVETMSAELVKLEKRLIPMGSNPNDRDKGIKRAVRVL
jgi:hypothetical protein